MHKLICKFCGHILTSDHILPEDACKELMNDLGQHIHTHIRQHHKDASIAMRDVQQNAVLAMDALTVIFSIDEFTVPIEDENHPLVKLYDSKLTQLLDYLELPSEDEDEEDNEVDSANLIPSIPVN